MVASIIIVVFCFIFSAYFSASETVFSVVNRLRIKKEAEEGNKASKYVLKTINDFDMTSATILLGNNLVNIAAAIFGSNITSALLTPVFPDNPTLVGTLGAIIIVVALLIVGEIFPKVLGMRYSYAWSKIFVWPIIGFKYLFFPIVWPISKLANLIFKRKKKDEDEEVNKEEEAEVTDDELLEMVDVIQEGGLIDESQSELVKSAIDFTDITANEVMTPRVDVFGIDINDDINEIVKDIELFSHSRIPVYDGSLDNIVGVIKSIDVLKELNNNNKNININDFLQEAYFVPESMQISTILEELRGRKRYMAIVIDEYGGMAGILTLEDIVEELVGDIWDEMDTVEEDYTVQNENEFLVDGAMNLEDFFELVGLDIDDYDGDSSTVNGWCTEELERFAKVNDEFEYRNLKIIITKAEEFTIEQIKVIREINEDED